MNSILHRMSELADNEGITITGLEQKIGASKGVLSRALTKHTDIQSKWLVELVENYPRYNSEWLLTGKGSMFKNAEGLTSELFLNESIPLIPIDAMAKFKKGPSEIIEYDTHRYVVPEFTELNADFMIRVKGSSMYPKYSSGDLVACKRLPLDSFFQWHKVYVLDTIQGAMIKRIHQSDKEGYIKCVSENEKYVPFDIKIEEIHSLALVVGVIRLE